MYSYVRGSWAPTVCLIWIINWEFTIIIICFLSKWSNMIADSFLPMYDFELILLYMNTFCIIVWNGGLGSKNSRTPTRRAIFFYVGTENGGLLVTLDVVSVRMWVRVSGSSQPGLVSGRMKKLARATSPCFGTAGGGAGFVRYLGPRSRYLTGTPIQPTSTH